MCPVKDETGNRYKKLLVLERTESSSYGRVAWLCLCDCGNKVVVFGDNLRCGNVKSCGCLLYSTRLPDGEVGLTALIRQMRQSARRRGHVWELTRKQVRTLTSQPCCYCGLLPSKTIGYGCKGYTYNGLDRQNNNVGYIESNCVPCCKVCNWAKGTKSVEQFLTWITEVYNHRCTQGLLGR